MAPEVLRKEYVKDKSEIYPQIIVYYMMTKSLPDYRSIVLKGSFPQIPSCYSQGLVDICIKFLKDNPNDRLFVNQLFSEPIICKELQKLI